MGNIEEHETATRSVAKVANGNLLRTVRNLTGKESRAGKIIMDKEDEGLPTPVITIRPDKQMEDY